MFQNSYFPTFFWRSFISLSLHVSIIRRRSTCKNMRIWKNVLAPTDVSSRTKANACNIEQLKQGTSLKDSNLVVVFAFFLGTVRFVSALRFFYLNRFAVGKSWFNWGEIFIDYLPWRELFPRKNYYASPRLPQISVFISKSIWCNVLRGKSAG